MWFRLGDAYTKQGIVYQIVEQKWDLAERQFKYAENSIEEAIYLDEEYVAALTQLGVIYYHQRRLNLALETLFKVVSIAPRNARAWGYIGSAYADNGQANEADEAYRQEAKYSKEGARPNYTYGKPVPLKNR